MRKSPEFNNETQGSVRDKLSKVIAIAGALMVSQPYVVEAQGLSDERKAEIKANEAKARAKIDAEAQKHGGIERISESDNYYWNQGKTKVIFVGPQEVRQKNDFYYAHLFKFIGSPAAMDPFKTDEREKNAYAIKAILEANNIHPDYRQTPKNSDNYGIVELDWSEKLESDLMALTSEEVQENVEKERAAEEAARIEAAKNAPKSADEIALEEVSAKRLGFDYENGTFAGFFPPKDTLEYLGTRLLTLFAPTSNEMAIKNKVGSRLKRVVKHFEETAQISKTTYHNRVAVSVDFTREDMEYVRSMVDRAFRDDSEMPHEFREDKLLTNEQLTAKRNPDPKAEQVAEAVAEVIYKNHPALKKAGVEVKVVDGNPAYVTPWKVKGGENIDIDYVEPTPENVSAEYYPKNGVLWAKILNESDGKIYSYFFIPEENLLRLQVYKPGVKNDKWTKIPIEPRD